MTTNPLQNHERWMAKAIELARYAAQKDEVPVGALVVREGTIIGEGWNQPISANDPSAHAEIIAIRQAALKLGNYRLPDCDLYVTIEPCTMCIGAIIHARIRHLIFGAREPRAGVVCSHLNLPDETLFNHKIQWTEGVLADECSNMMADFFRQRR